MPAAPVPHDDVAPLTLLLGIRCRGGDGTVPLGRHLTGILRRI